jgi:lipoprotein-releasing system permease protein
MTPITPAKPFSRWEWALAFRYLRTKRQNAGIGLIATIAFLAISLAIAVLIIVMSVMNGFRAELLKGILGFNGHAYVQGEALWAENWPDVIARLQQAPGVVSVSPLVESQAVVQGQIISGAIVRGVTREDLLATPLIAENIKEGSMEEFGAGDYGGDTILMGTRLAEQLGVLAGDYVTLVTFGGMTPFGTPRTNPKDYYIGGIFEVGNSEFDQLFIMMPLEQAQLYFDRGEDVDIIEIKVEDPDNVQTYLPAIRAAAGERAVVTTWQDRNASYWGALQVERNMMRIILMLVIGIAALNIISALVMLVKNKERDIAILRTMGAGQGAIMRVFLISGAAIGVTAAPFGVLLGVLFCWNIEYIQRFIDWLFGAEVFSPDIYFLSSLPAKLDWTEVWIVFGWTLGVSILVTLYPSWRASRTDPVEALRYE